jgi:hypothetical protein
MAIPNYKRFMGLIIPFFLAACLIAGYWFYWNKVANEIEARVRAAVPVASAAEVDVTGFPYRLTLDIKGVTLKSPNGLGFAASSVVATATPFNPLLWILEAAHDPAVILPSGKTLPLKAQALKASLRLKPQGIERFSLTFDGLVAQGDGGFSLGKGLAHLMTSFADDQTLGFVVELDAITLARPLSGPGAILGQTINHVRIAGPISQGQTLMTSPRTWRDAGGKLTVMAGDVKWGPVSLFNATGVISLSSSNEVNAQLSGQGALMPEGVAVTGLSGPISLNYTDQRLSIGELPSIDLTDAFR